MKPPRERSGVAGAMQLPLSIQLRESATFANFVAGGDEMVVAALRHACQSPAQERFIYLWGGHGGGKSHLLQAACHEVASRGGGGSLYLPLAEADQLAPQMLEGMEQMGVVAIDDVDAIAGERGWEEALFHLYNRLRDEGSGALIVSSRLPLPSLALQLPDLKSRLAWGLVFQLRGLDDRGKLQALQQGAQGRGLDLPEEVGSYLLRHYHRDLSRLFELLERLDNASLAVQRRLTIPFVKDVIDSE